MTPEELQSWLTSHEEPINSFMDYEIYFEAPSELVETIGMWTQNEKWNEDGTKFVHLGADGTGSMFLVWLKPGESTGPIAFLGSEGSYGILTKSPEDFAHAIAYGPEVDEDWDDGNSTLSESNWNLTEGDQEDIDEAKEKLENYKNAAIKKFGALKSFNSISEEGLESHRAEFSKWLESKLPV